MEAETEIPLGSQEFGKMENMGGMMEGLGGIDPSQAWWVIVSFLIFSTWLEMPWQVANMQKMMGGKMKGRR